MIRGSRKPKELLARLRAFPGEGVAPEVLADVRDQLRKEEDQLASDRRLGESLRELQKGFSSAVEKEWSPRIVEVLKALEDAPDAARPRLDAFAKADATASTEAKLALAMSGWIVGPDRATATLADAMSLWKARKTSSISSTPRRRWDDRRPRGPGGDQVRGRRRPGRAEARGRTASRPRRRMTRT